MLVMVAAYFMCFLSKFGFEYMRINGFEQYVHQFVSKEIPDNDLNYVVVRGVCILDVQAISAREVPRFDCVTYIQEKCSCIHASISLAAR